MIRPALVMFLCSRLLLFFLACAAALGLPTVTESIGPPQADWDFLRVFLHGACASDERWLRGLTAVPGGLGLQVLALVVLQIPVLGAFVELYRLAREITADEEAARRALAYFSVFPTCIWLSLPNSDGVLLWVALLAFRQARQNRWPQAWTLGLAGCLLREAGFFLGLVLTLAQLRSPSPMRFLRALAFFLLVLLGTGMPHAVGPVSLSGEGLWLPLAWLTSLAAWRQFGWALGLYALLLSAAPWLLGWSDPLRYLIQAFPLFLCWGIWGRRASFDQFLYAGLSLLLGLWVVYWTRGVPL